MVSGVLLEVFRFSPLHVGILFLTEVISIVVLRPVRCIVGHVSQSFAIVQVFCTDLSDF